MNAIEKASAVAKDGVTVRAHAVDLPKGWEYTIAGDGTSSRGDSVKEAAETWLTIRRGYVNDRRHGERRKYRR